MGLKLKLFISCLILFLLGIREGAACAVCYGNPDSDMVRGAKAGVIFLIFVIYGILMGMAGIAGFWVYRARKLAATSTMAGDPSLPPQS